jgi:hypothetical protein
LTGYACPMTIPPQCKVPGQILETLHGSTRSQKRFVQGEKFSRALLTVWLHIRFPNHAL